MSGVSLAPAWLQKRRSKRSRTDFNISVSASAVLTPVEYVSLGATASFVGNYSSSSRADYEVVSPSLVIGGRISF